MLFSLPFLPIGLLLLFKSSDARPFSGPVFSPSNGYRVRYGDLGWMNWKFGDCIPDVREGRSIDMAEIYQPTRCYIYGDSQCQQRDDSIVLHYKPGTYNTHVPKPGYKICVDDPQN